MADSSAHLDKAAAELSKACGRKWDPTGDPEMYYFYRRAAERMLSVFGFTKEERSFYDHAEPYSTGYEYRLVSPWFPYAGDA